MLITAYLRWWYGPGWRDNGRRLRSHLRHTYLEFSVPMLLGTLFAPWRRIVTAGSGSLGQRFRASIDNLFSRAIGLVVRLLALTAALIIMALTLVAGGSLYIIWPFMPILGPILIILAVVSL